jgi:hypothetical protein
MSNELVEQNPEEALIAMREQARIREIAQSYVRNGYNNSKTKAEMNIADATLHKYLKNPDFQSALREEMEVAQGISAVFQEKALSENAKSLLTLHEDIDEIDDADKRARAKLNAAKVLSDITFGKQKKTNITADDKRVTLDNGDISLSFLLQQKKELEESIEIH